MAPQLSEDEVDDLLYLARVGDNDELSSLLRSIAEREKVSPAEILSSAKDEGQSTCLHMATGNGHVDTIAALLEHFKDRPKEERQAFLDAANEYGNTGMHWAALGGHLAAVKLLMAHGASPALANGKNYVPLDLASFNGKDDVVDYFLQQVAGLESNNAAGGKGGGLNGAVEGLKLEEEEGEEKGEEENGPGTRDGEGGGGKTSGRETEKEKEKDGEQQEARSS